MQEQTETRREAEIIASYGPPLVNEAEKEPYFDYVDDNDGGKALVQSVIDKRIARNPHYAGMTVVIDKVNIHYDNNLTVVVVDSGDNQVVGWAKFNPKDVRYISGTSKKGHYWIRKESKYRDMAGIMKAIDRAVDKLLNPSC